jgi:rod shape-determining protein MreC
MSASRDDFVIAIRSAFLKKSYQQKFSLLTLLFLSLITILLDSFNFKAIQYLKIGVNEAVYRSSFVVSIPENYLKNLNIQLKEHMQLYEKYKKNEILLKNFQSKELTSNFLLSENNRLRKLIDERIQSTDIHAKVLVDKDSPYLKSIILNKGSKDGVKLGMAILDDIYLVGKIIEVNFTNSRVLLLSDLNSKIPVLLEPQDLHAVISGTGKNFGVIEHTKDEYKKEIKQDKVIVYTSGDGGIFKSGIPVGKIKTDKVTNESIVNFFSDFGQLDYVKIVSFKKLTTK